MHFSNGLAGMRFLPCCPTLTLTRAHTLQSLREPEEVAKDNHLDADRSGVQLDEAKMQVCAWQPFLDKEPESHVFDGCSLAGGEAHAPPQD
jgi:hypothetical protein